MKNVFTKTDSAIEKTKQEEIVEVLCQKMGDRWFAFSLINDEVFIGSICQDELEKTENSHSRKNKVSVTP